MGVELVENISKPAEEKILLKTNRRPTGPIAFSPDSTTVGIAVEHGQIELWKFKIDDNTVMPHLLSTVGEMEDVAISALTLCEGEALVCVGNEAGQVACADISKKDGRVLWVVPNLFVDWPASIKAQLSFRHKQFRYAVTSLHFMVEEKYLIAVYRNGPTRIFSLSEPERSPNWFYLIPDEASNAILELSRREGRAGRGIAKYPRNWVSDFEAKGKQLAIGKDDGFIELWRLGEITHDVELGPKDGDTPATARIGESWYRELFGLGSAVKSVRFSKKTMNPAQTKRFDSSNRISAADVRNRISSWSLEGLHGVGYSQYREGDPGLIYAIAFLSDSGDKIAFGGSRSSDTLAVDAKSLKLTKVSEPTCQLSKRIRALATSADNRLLLAATGVRSARGRYVQILEMSPSGYRSTRPISLHSDGLWAAAVEPEGRIMVTGGWDQMAIVWSRNPEGSWQRTPLRDAVNGHKSPVLSVAVRPGGGDIITGTKNGVIRRWQRNPDGYTLSKLLANVKTPVRALAFSPGGDRLVAGDDRGYLRSWKVVEKEYQVERVLPAHSGVVYAIGFDRKEDGDMVSGGSDGRVCLWQTGRLEHPLTLGGPVSEVHSVALSPEGNRIAAGDAFGTVHVWDLGIEKVVDLACKAMRRNLTKEEWERFAGNNIPYQKTCPDLPSGN
jgi:WD40 repeat protein